MLNRKNTNFCTAITAKLLEQYEASEYKTSLAYYQILVGEYMAMNVSKGLLLGMVPGSGKTASSYHIAAKLLEDDPTLKCLIIAPKTLVKNFQNSAARYEEFTGKHLDMSKFFFVRSSISTEKQIALLNPIEVSVFDSNYKFDPKATNAKTLSRSLKTKAENIVKTLTNLDGYVIFIEESHMFNRKIINGSPSVLRLYDLMMKSKCRIVMLSGSLISSSPFELAPMMNLLAGERVFPENQQEFEELFVDTQTNTMMNVRTFQDRIFGLVSRVKTEYFSEEDLKDYPTKLPEIVHRLPMDKRHLANYITTRERELDDEHAMSKGKNNSTKRVTFDRFSTGAKTSGTYRVRSRQACNFVPSSLMLKYFKERGHPQSDIDAEVYAMSPIDSGCNKCHQLADMLCANPGQKFVTYSQFTRFGGGLSIASFLLKHGAKEVGGDSISIAEIDNKRWPGLANITFARVNGSLTEEEQDDMVKLYNAHDNDRGEKLTMLIIGKEQCMGLDLACVRHIIMFEPHFKDFIKEQLMYRGNRKKSHLRLPEKDRTMQFHVFLSVYPDDFDPTYVPETVKGVDDEVYTTHYGEEMLTTTDEFMYDVMTNNGILMNNFKSAVDEVAIECELIRHFNPKSTHLCRTCAPNDQSLYTSSKQDQPSDAIRQDIKLGSQCRPYVKQKVIAQIITLVSGDNATDYYYIPAKNLYGYKIFFKEDDKFLEIPASSPVFKLILAEIKLKK